MESSEEEQQNEYGSNDEYRMKSKGQGWKHEERPTEDDASSHHADRQTAEMEVARMNDKEKGQESVVSDECIIEAMR